MTDVDALLTELRQFVAERDWAPVPRPEEPGHAARRRRSASYVAEYRWVAGPRRRPLARADARARIADEIGDVGIALLLLCDRTGIDLGDAVTTKLARNHTRFPADDPTANPPAVTISPSRYLGYPNWARGDASEVREDEPVTLHHLAAANRDRVREHRSVVREGMELATLAAGIDRRVQRGQLREQPAVEVAPREAGG